MQSCHEEVVHTKGSPEFRQELNQAEMAQVLDKRRRIPGQPKKSWEATQLWDRYQEIARRIVLGQKQVQIAEDLGVTPEMVSYVRNSPIVKDQIANLQEKANEETVNIASRIKSLAPHAIEVLEDVIKTGEVSGERIPAKLRAHHAEKLLDRAGYAPPKEIRALNLSGHFTVDEIEEIKKRAMARACEQAIVVSDD